MKRLFLVVSLSGLIASQFPSCGGIGHAPDGGGGGGGQPGTGGAVASGGSGMAIDGGIQTGGVMSTDGEVGIDGAMDSGEAAIDVPISPVATLDTGAGAAYVVAMVQSAKSQASEITQADVVELVTNAVAQAGGLDFIKDGQTIVLKPNIVTPYQDYARRAMPQTVNGVSTDWRVTKAVADLVRAKNPNGKILVMEGSVVPAAIAFSLMGYTAANFGASVDEFVAIEGASCADRSTNGLVQKSVGGKTFWLNQRYAAADVIISLPTLKTHISAGITGAVKNLGIGGTPVSQYAASPVDGGVASSEDCTRGQTAAHIDHSTPELLGQFIADFYSARPADFVVMDGLQGLQNGPASMWAGTKYESDKMNMRLILAGKNAVAVDTIQATVMKCDPKKVPYLTKLEANGLGTTDLAQITVVGKQPGEVAKAFACKLTDICPGL